MISSTFLLWMVFNTIFAVKIDLAKQPTTTAIPTEINNISTVTTNSTSTTTSTTLNTTDDLKTTTISTPTTSIGITIGTTTISGITTQSVNITTTTPIPPIINPFSGFINRRADNKVKDYYCKCDLQINICEINCCCDLDCSKEVVKLFDCSAEKFDIQEFDYLGGLESCEISGGLLCIVSSDLKEKAGTFYDSSKKGMTNSIWPAVFEINSASEPSSKERYEHGDFLIIFNETSETIEKLLIPIEAIEQNCIVSSPVKWLKDFKSKCIQQVNSMNLSMTEQWTTIKVLKYPTISTMEFHCTPESCSNVTFSQDIKDHTETNLIIPEKILFTIWHNFTHIQGDVELNVTYRDITDNDFESQLIFQTFEIKFRSVDEKNTHKWEMSGSPGYLKEKPLLISKKITFTNYTEEFKEYVLDFFVFNNRSEPYHAVRNFKLPKSQQRKCILTKDDHMFINFGENLYKKCNVHLNSTVQEKNVTVTNFTEICLTYQEQIFSYLINGYNTSENNYTSNLFVSQSGHPRNHTDHWTPLEFKFKDINSQENIEQVSGIWRQDTSDTFTCSNMIISIRYEFYYARLKISGINQQNIIKGAEVHFGPRLDLHFKVSDISVPIYIQTQFYDMTNNGYSVKIQYGVLILALLVSILITIYLK